MDRLLYIVLLCTLVGINWVSGNPVLAVEREESSATTFQKSLNTSNPDSLPLNHEQELTRQYLEDLNTGKDAELCESCLVLGEFYLKSAKPVLALEKTKETLAQTNCEPNDSLYAEMIKLKGSALFHMGHFREAEECYLEYLESKLVKENLSKKAEALRFLGTVNIRLGNYERALVYNQESLSLVEPSGNASQLLVLYNNIGTIHTYLRDFETASGYFKKVLMLAENLPPDQRVTAALINMATIHRENGIPDSALMLDTRALEYSGLHNLKLHEIQIYEALGQDMMLLMKYREGENYLRKAIGLAKEKGNIYLYYHSIHSLGELFFREKKYRQAENLISGVLQDVINFGQKELLADYYHLMSSVQEKLGNNTRALKYFKTYKSYSDSLVNEMTKMRITELQLRYSNEKQKNELDILKTKQEMLLLDARRNRVEKFLLTIIIILGLGASIVGILALKKSLRAGKELEKKNAELAEAIQIKNRLFSIVAHDLKTPLNAIVGLSSLITQRDGQDKDSVLKYASYINSSGLQGFEMIEKLLEWSMLNLGEIPVEIKKQDFGKLCSRVCEEMINQASLKNIEIIEEIEDNLWACFDEYSLNCILRNLISNAIKFSPENTEIHIIAGIADNELRIEVRDQGVGIPEADQAKVLDPKQHISTAGTGKEKGSGLGLSLSREFVKLNKGKIWFNSAVGKGTSFFVTLPVNRCG